jgi:hypothetical protein
MELAIELAAKVRGYFTNSKGQVDLRPDLDGDRDLYNLASRITLKVLQPGTGKVMRATKKTFCRKHSDTELVCPKCSASRGGKVTAKKYSAAQMREWGKRGGRPRKVVDETQTT